MTRSSKALDDILFVHILISLTILPSVEITLMQGPLFLVVHVSVAADRLCNMSWYPLGN